MNKLTQGEIAHLADLFYRAVKSGQIFLCSDDGTPERETIGSAAVPRNSVIEVLAGGYHDEDGEIDPSVFITLTDSVIASLVSEEVIAALTVG